jgi:hypothetical protein
LSELKACRRPTHRSPDWVLGLVLTWTLVCIGAAAAGCDGGPAESTAATQAPGTEAATTTTAAPMTAATVATGVIDTWAEAMQRVVGLLEGTPQPDAIRAEVESLKEEYIQRLIAYGRQRQELTAAAQEEMNSLTFLGMGALSEEPWYKMYMSLYGQYSSGDLEFSNLLASFNILTQYADFELLKRQAPEEAARLGIE